MIELLHTDCMDYMAGLPDKAFDLAIVDPPYGLGSRIFAGGRHNKAGRVSASQYEGKKWDNRPTSEYFSALFRVSINQVVWGGNYFSMPPCRGFLIWDKKQPMPTMSFGEYAWTSFDCPAKRIDFAYTNYVEGVGAPSTKIHPTQKPVGLYARVIALHAKEGDRILDTHLGSGSSAIAAHYGGFDFVGCELDEDYYKAACERFDNETKQQAMF